MATANFDPSSQGTQAINNILAQEANRIGQDIHKMTLHTSPWLDLTKQSAFPEGMGYQLTTLVYDRALATTDTTGNTAGVSWQSLTTLQVPAADGNTFGTSLANEQLLIDAAQDGRGPRDTRSYVQFGRKLKKYSLERAMIESPRISLEDLRFAAHRQEQLRAIMEIMTEVTRNTWENRYRDEYDKVVDNITFCKTSESATVAGNEGVATVDVALGANTPTANISNKVLDGIYYQLIRKGAGNNAYGRENGRPVFSIVLSSEASYALQTEAGFRDDVRYNNAKVSDLIAPLGIEKSFRGFYHLIDDLAPRFTLDTDTDDGGPDTADGTLNRVEPYTISGGVAVPSAAYESAPYEAAFILHPEVCEAQIPNPFSGSNGVTFNPVNYRGQFKWTNILNEITNPDGTIGFFRGILSSATKPIKTEFGYVVVFQRTAATPAA